MEKDSRLKVINRDVIKYIIIFFMFWGHLFAWLSVGDTPPDGLFEDCPLWQRIFIELSLLTPPVMFFFIADGYKYTRSVKKYAQRLFLFACITQVPFTILWGPITGWWGANIMFTLFFCLLTLCAWESHFKLWQRIALVMLICGATAVLVSEWMIFGPLTVLGLHIFREKPKARLIWYSSVWAAYILMSFIPYCIQGLKPIMIEVTAVHIFDFAAAYALMTVFYNGKKGRFPKFSKWFFYIFYPAHLWLAVILRLVLK
ncbi:TraX family protein [Ruminococcus flavefaciens]|uniref:TraX family protein n=1 Tax=Ruminococcus flavefaciens TaxID=1265 RepID=UPI000467D50F|nr:TraX family protein [Ruminococcus flavefaciens]